MAAVWGWGGCVLCCHRLQPSRLTALGVRGKLEMGLCMENLQMFKSWLRTQNLTHTVGAKQKSLEGSTLACQPVGGQAGRERLAPPRPPSQVHSRHGLVEVG